MMTVVVAGCLVALVFCWLYTQPTSTPSHAYVLTNKTTHARLLPVESKHAFSYPTLALIVSLDALERSALDLPISLPWGFPLGYLFRFGSIWRTLVGLRGEGYLSRQNGKRLSPASIRTKLDQVLLDNGAITAPSEVRDVWMMTMPAICGLEGINPLTVYYCYRPTGEVSAVVLEVHNTFGEGHVYVLQLGRNEDPLPLKGYNHQWTFARRFFVSPFNDRSGFYSVAIKLPSHAPFGLSSCGSPEPNVRIELRIPNNTSAEPSVGPLEIVAHLTPQRSIPLTALNLFITLSRYPFALFITLPRIMYQAWILHYRKHLPVYARPEPMPAVSVVSVNEHDVRDLSPPGDLRTSERNYPGGIFHQEATLLERYARQRTFTFLEQRCAETGINIVLLSGDSSTPVWKRSARKDTNDPSEPSTLTVLYTSSRVFTLFLLAPSAHLFFCAGCKSKTDGEYPVFNVSDEDAYVRVFEPGKRRSKERPGWTERTTQWIRSVPIPRDVLRDCERLRHPLATLPSSFAARLLDLTVVSVLVIQDWILERVFWLLWVRFVPGTEPWMKNIWRRTRTAVREGQHLDLVGH